MRFTTGGGSCARRCRLAVVFAVLAVLAGAPPAFAQPSDVLARARTYYNEGQFEEAIRVADEARLVPELAAGADLIAARSYLERYRQSAALDDLSHARERLRRLNPHTFTFREQLEYLIGLGQALFFEGSPGAAADVFASALEGPFDFQFDQRERVLDWWASAMDGDARPRSDLERQPIYQALAERMRVELSANPASAVAAYWTAAAARGRGDLQSAWDAAQAGWVRAPLAPDHGAALRGDLDRLVQRAIVPERARLLSQPAERLLAEWEQFKERWNR
jgi:hypothetical protein